MSELPHIHDYTLRWIASYIEREQRSPSLKELAYGVGVSSINTAHWRKDWLQKQGYIDTLSGARGIVLTERGERYLKTRDTDIPALRDDAVVVPVDRARRILANVDATKMLLQSRDAARRVWRTTVSAHEGDRDAAAQALADEYRKRRAS